jgi:hypothetical protein
VSAKLAQVPGKTNINAHQLFELRIETKEDEQGVRAVLRDIIFITGVTLNLRV